MKILSRLTFIILFSVCFVNASFAVVSSNHNIQIKSSYINFAEVKNTNKKNHIDLNLTYDGNYSLTKDLKGNLAIGVYGATYPDYAVTAPTFNLAYHLGESSFHIGRSKVEKLSYLDTDWYLGVQTAFLRINPLNPEEQGRLGLSYKFKSDQVFVELYGSPVSIPDQFPGFEVSDAGKVSSDNPWSNIPPEKVRIDTGAEFDLRYEVINDSLPELLLAYQFGGAFGIKTDYLEIVGMYSNRPSKQVDLKLDAKVQTGTGSLVEVTAEPLFLREHFFGLQAKSKWFPSFTMKNGFYGLVLEEDDIDADYQTSHSDYFFITTDFNFKIKNYILSLKHLYTKERENIKDDVVYVNLSRFMYENSVHIVLQNVLLEKVTSNIGGIYSYKEKVARLYVESSYKKNRNWTFWGRLNLIHKVEESDDGDLSVSSGLESYAALDSLNLGISYVF